MRKTVLQIAMGLGLMLGADTGSARATAPAPSTKGRDAGVDAPLDPSMVAKVVKDHLTHLKWCYETSLDLDPSVAGRVVVGWTIDHDGAVRGLKFEKNTIRDPAFSACLRRHLEALRFKPPAGGSVEVSFPFLFQPDVAAPTAGAASSPTAAPDVAGAVPADPLTAQQVARVWLNAVRRADTMAIQNRSAFPLTIAGFELDAGPEREACGGRARRDGLVGVRAFMPTSRSRWWFRTPSTSRRASPVS